MTGRPGRLSRRDREMVCDVLHRLDGAGDEVLRAVVGALLGRALERARSRARLAFDAGSYAATRAQLRHARRRLLAALLDADREALAVRALLFDLEKQRGDV